MAKTIVRGHVRLMDAKAMRADFDKAWDKSIAACNEAWDKSIVEFKKADAKAEAMYKSAK